MAPSGPSCTLGRHGASIAALLSPHVQLLPPMPPSQRTPGETCVSTDSFPRCPWSRMRPGVSPEAHPLGYGRSQRDFTRVGPAVRGEAVSPGDGQPHAPCPRAQSPPAKRDGSSTPVTCGSVLPAKLIEM